MTGIDINDLLDHISPELMKLYYLCDTTDDGYEYVGPDENEANKADQVMEVVLEFLVLWDMPTAYFIHTLKSIDLAHILEYGRFKHHLSTLEMYYTKVDTQEDINGGYLWDEHQREKLTKLSYYVE